jgi:hypothetical protein
MNVPQIYSPSFVQFVISGTSYAPNQLLLSTGASGLIACQNFNSGTGQVTYYVSYLYTTLYQAAVYGSPIYTDFGLTMPAPNGTYSDGSEVAFLFSGNGVATGYATCASQVTTSTTTTTTTHALIPISVHLAVPSSSYPTYCSSYTTATVYIYAASLGPGLTLYLSDGVTKYDPSGTYGFVYPSSGGQVYGLANSVTTSPQGNSC